MIPILIALQSNKEWKRPLKSTETRLSVEQIESIRFDIPGNWSYHLKKVEVTRPEQNVAGLIRIDGNYYKQVTNH